MNKKLLLFFLNPSDEFKDKIFSYIILNGFRETDKNIYEYKNKKIELYNGYSSGNYISLNCTGINKDIICDFLKKCPECGSTRIKPSILPCWRNEAIEQAYYDGLLDYGPGAYDRVGTMPQTRTCIDCGCKWHNSEDLQCWTNEIKKGNKLTREMLGI